MASKASKLHLEEPFMIFIIKCLNIFGVWPTSENTIIQIISMIHFLATIFLLIVLEGIYIYLKIDEDYVESIKTIGTTTYHTIGALKILHWIQNVHSLHSVLKILERDSFKFENFYTEQLHICDEKSDIPEIENFCQERVSNNRLKMKNKYDRIMNLHRFMSFFLYWSMVIGANMSLAFSYISGLTIPIEVFDDKFNKTVTKYELPYHNYDLVDMDNSKNFVLMGLYQFYVIWYLSITFLCIELFIWGIMIHMTGQIIVIQTFLKNIRLASSISRNRDETLANIQLYKCIDETNAIITINDKLNKLLGNSLTMQFLLGMLVMCNVAYIVPQEKQPLKLFGYFLFVFLISCDPLIMGLVTQNLTDEFLKLAQAVYLINWDDATPKFRKNLVFMMARLQKPFVIKLSNVMPYGLNVYISIMTKTYSFYTLISKSNK